jgi:hypothetical protein
MTVKIARIPKPVLVDLTCLIRTWSDRQFRVRITTNRRSTLEGPWPTLEKKAGEDLDSLEHYSAFQKCQRRHLENIDNMGEPDNLRNFALEKGSVLKKLRWEIVARTP